MLNDNNQQIKSVLTEITNPLSFSSVSRLVRQVEGLNNIQRNIRDHKNLNNKHDI